MNKKIAIIIICVVLLSALGFGIYLIIKGYDTDSNDNEHTENNSKNEIVFNETDNSQVITTNSNSTIRVINYYDEEMFKGKNTILFMWASWCPNCATEMAALNEILAKYKNDPDLNIVFIAHEFKESGIDGLIELLEGGTVDFDTEILLDFGRVIRHEIDPEAGTVPKTYFLDKDLNVLHKIDYAITVEQIETAINEYFK